MYKKSERSSEEKFNNEQGIKGKLTLDEPSIEVLELVCQNTPDYTHGDTASTA